MLIHFSQVFLKGYQWPFDSRRVVGGSSIVDILVYIETVIKGRRVFLDYRRNPEGFRFDQLSDEAREYLTKSNALQDTPLEMGPLCLSSGSHRHDLGRDQPISDAGQKTIVEKLVGMDLPSDERSFYLGDVSFHMGWTFHRAGAK